ncbi:hypothetical protein [uncultured Nostoc sp.]|uniref:hypothetical protein n=1 Tax=uncultured Nostoc sp. TaxID=340711 RepID=UPI0035CB0840
MAEAKRTQKLAITEIRDKTWYELYIDGDIYPKQNYTLPINISPLSLVVTEQVNQLTYEPNHRSF